MHDSPANPTALRLFGGARMAVGAVSWLAPETSARIFGIDPRRQSPIVTQLFGARDFALGLLTATSSGPARAQVLRVGVALDLADTVASARQIHAGELSHQAKLMVAAGAASFAALGALALRAETS